MKLSVFGALPAYLGGKRRLCPLIFREIDRVVSRRLWPGLTFLDGFLGGGSVSLYAKAQGFKVLSVDVAERAIVVGEALVANSRVRLTHEDALRVARDGGEPSGQVECTYVPSAFTRRQARFLDRTLAAAASTVDPAKRALLCLLAIRVAMAAHAMNDVRPGTAGKFAAGSHESISPRCVRPYVDGPRLLRPERLWSLAQRINAGVFEGKGSVMKADLLDVLHDLRADVAYFDPPYPGVTGYGRAYKIIDEMLGDEPRFESPFSTKDGAGVLDTLFERARHIPVWILSYGNAVAGIEELKAKMTWLGRETRAIAVPYTHKAAVASEEKNRANREFLVVGWDPEASLLREIKRPAPAVVEVT